MLERDAAIAVTSCLFASLLTVSTSVTARAAECLSAPNGQSGPGTHWRYRIRHATGERCWYLKRVGEAARPRPTPESLATPRTPRSGSSEPATSAETTTEKSSVRAWFSSTFAAFTALGRSATTTETNEAPAKGNTSEKAERGQQKKPHQSKLEQQEKPAESKAKKEESETARSPSHASSLQVILEAGGDKDVPGAIEMSEDQR